MPSLVKIAAAQLQPSYLLGFNELPCFNISGISRHFYFHKFTNFSLTHNHSRRFCSINATGDAQGLSNASDDADKLNGKGLARGLKQCRCSAEKNDSTKVSLSSGEMLKRLKRYGISGILSYGLLNTAYYLTTFLVVWFYVAPAPGKMGYLAAVERFLKIMAMVWAGSQVTKLIRAGGALALAPFVDRGLSWFASRFNYESRQKAFVAIVGLCFGLAVIVFFVITLLWA